MCGADPIFLPQVSVVLEPLYDRQPHHNNLLEDNIESVSQSMRGMLPRHDVIPVHFRAENAGESTPIYKRVMQGNGIRVTENCVVHAT